MESESQWVDFKEVKRAVPIEQVLHHYGIKLKRVNRTSLRGACPLPTHSSEKTGTSFGVNLEKNIWACQSASCVKARSDKKGGNQLDFVAAMEQCSVRDAALKLVDWFHLSGAGEELTKTEKLEEQRSTVELVAGGRDTTESREEKLNKPLSFTLKGIDSTHSYLMQRGITEETANHFGAGFFPGKGSVSGRVVIPIHNEAGELIAYAGRAIDGTEPKYKLPLEFKKTYALYNLNRVLAFKRESRVHRVIVVEGFFGTMRIHQAGFPHVVALMGSSMSSEQENLLASHFKGIVLMLDGDEAGQRATEEIALRLARRAFLRIASVPDGKQPDELSDEELKNILGSL